MNWIDERLEERRQADERKNLIYMHAENVFRSLWENVQEFVREASAKGEPVGWNGSTLERIVWASQTAQGGQRRELSIALNRTREKSFVRARASKVDFVLDIDVMEDGQTVGLKHKGKEIEDGDAAIMLLDPFLFPGLPPREPVYSPGLLSQDVEEAMRRIEHDKED